mmetsp:Transcript_17511/g.26070  ORF Transcript_17511/g.26070 Transcript_17511/m.26070 type:complete len:242 (-) Transcript_17511:633-1358(-)
MKRREGVIFLLVVSLVMVGMLEDEVSWVAVLGLVVVRTFGLVDSLVSSSLSSSLLSSSSSLLGTELLSLSPSFVLSSSSLSLTSSKLSTMVTLDRKKSISDIFFMTLAPAPPLSTESKSSSSSSLSSLLLSEEVDFSSSSILSCDNTLSSFFLSEVSVCKPKPSSLAQDFDFELLVTFSSLSVSLVVLIPMTLKNSIFLRCTFSSISSSSFFFFGFKIEALFGASSSSSLCFAAYRELPLL